MPSVHETDALVYVDTLNDKSPKKKDLIFRSSSGSFHPRQWDSKIISVMQKAGGQNL